MRIAIDAGHGLYTSGKRCDARIDPNQTREWTLNSRIISLLDKRLKAYDVETIRLDDPTGVVDVPVGERKNIANTMKADFCICVHHNAGVHCGTGGGVVVFYDPTRPDNLAYCQHAYDYIVKHNGLVGNRSKHVNSKSLAVARVDCHSIYLENGFMDSLTDTPIILTDEFAQNTVDGIIEFLENILHIKKKASISVSDVLYIGKVNATDFLNIRSEPTSDANNVVDMVMPDSFVLVKKEASNGWCYVNTAYGAEGWVYKKYLDVYHENDFTQRQVIDPTGLNIRDFTNVSGSLVATMPYGARFMVLEQRSRDSWLQCWCGQTIGYCSPSDKYSKNV